MSKANTFRYDIQLLRAFAVLSVLLFHLNKAWLPGGFLGVDIFFVVSGYLISLNILRESQAGKFLFKNFYKRRITRLFPAAFVTISATLFVAQFIWPLDRISTLFEAALASILSVANIYFWLQSGYFDSSSIQKPLLHMWSLGVEEQFYLVFPVLFVLLIGFRRKILFISIVFLLLLSVILSEYMVRAASEAAFYLFPLRAYQFLCGTLLALLPVMPVLGHTKRHHQIKAGCFILSLLLLVGLMVIGLDESTPMPGIIGFGIAGLTAGLIGLGQSNPYIDRFSKLRPIPYIGRISYSLYLAHWPVIVFLSYNMAGQPIWKIAGWGFVLSFICGIILFHTIEQPFRKANLKHVLLRPLLGSLILFAIAFSIFMFNLNQTVQKRALIEAVRPQAQLALKTYLIGDSHASMYARAFRENIAGGDDNMTVSFIPGCPPIFGVKKVYSAARAKKNEARCNDMIRQWDADILMSDAKVVVLSARWEYYVSDKAPKAFSNRQDYLYRAGDNLVETKDYTRQVFTTELASTIEGLLAQNKKVVLIGQTPLQKISIVECAEQAKDEEDKDISERCGAALAEPTRQKLRPLREIFNEIQKDISSKNLIYVDPIDLFCDTQFCHVTRDGQPLYVDHNHLSERGANIVINHVVKQFTTSQ